jgi:hypothetical protein
VFAGAVRRCCSPHSVLLAVVLLRAVLQRLAPVVDLHLFAAVSEVACRTRWFRGSDAAARAALG